MNVNPYLALDGRCAEALEFYARIFNGEITMKMLFSEMPGENPFPPEMHDKIMHATMTAPDIIIMGTDQPAAKASDGTPVVTLSLNFPSLALAQPVFGALSNGGSVKMPLSKTFFSPGFGMCIDKYGVAWMVNAEDG